MLDTMHLKSLGPKMYLKSLGPKMPGIYGHEVNTSHDLMTLGPGLWDLKAKDSKSWDL